MQVYKAPMRDFRFVLEALGYEKIAKLPGYEDFDLETALALLEETGKFCSQEMLAQNRAGDQEGVRYDPETHAVTTPAGYKALYAKFIENGFGALSQPTEFGGQGAPQTVQVAVTEMATATNKSFSMCPGLTHGLVDAMLHYGTDAQKAYYLPKLISGEWSGTMCLTEPQCGTDLGLVRTRAVPIEGEPDAFALTGTKIWITFGDQDLTENIIHLVLARLPDAPAGIRGISTFLVPKVRPDGSRNPVFCGGLEHKMGIHGSPTCVMNLEGATGYLIGEPHRGMKTMFVMMNAARLLVGLEGLSLSDIAYQTALEFARERRQMRALDPKKREAGKEADTILVHPDVRRMLANIKATNEGMRALAYYVAIHLDVAARDPDEAARKRADGIVALLTPVVKAYMTERGFANISEAMQVTGGAGYTTDWSIEQYLRDARISLIYEGTNHIQALDLVGRKLPQDNGALYKTFIKEVVGFCKANADRPEMQPFVEPTKKAADTLSTLTMELAMKGMSDQEEAGAVASNYLTVFGLTSLAYMWARLADHALSKGDDRYAQTKLKTARYFYSNILPEIDSLVRIIGAGKASMMAFDVDEF